MVRYIFFGNNVISRLSGLTYNIEYRKNANKIFNVPNHLKTGFVEDGKWRQAPGFDLSHHK